MLDHPDYQIETEYLSYVLNYMKNIYEKAQIEKKEIDKQLSIALKQYNSDNIEEYENIAINQTLQSRLHLTVKNSNRSLKKPYFARTDFISSERSEPEKLYIGKMSLLREEDDYPLIVDWRAPISNLYYEGRMGHASYECPDGIIHGEIMLKRQYIIEDGELQDFFDIDVTASDEFLQIALGSNKDKRLKDIVSTIQAEQNRIIRASMHKAVVVQGAAGGGKTTIALHRIAYLLYNYPDLITSKNLMILAPNKYFISYISEVLPDLGVESVYQTTYEEFVKDLTDLPINVKNDSEKLSFLIEKPMESVDVVKISSFKSSMEYKVLMDYFIQMIVEEILGQKDFMLGEIILMTKDEINSLMANYSYLPITKRIKEIKKYLKNMLNRMKPQIIKRIKDQYEKKVQLVKRKYPQDSKERRIVIQKFYEKRDEEINRIESKAKGAVNKYFDTKIKNADEYYKDLYLNKHVFMECASGILDDSFINQIHNHTFALIQKNYFESEDVAAIAYLHLMFYGNDYFDLKHILIDEAQDMSLFQLYVLKLVMDTSSFTILGDLCQGIYSYKGISDWNEVIEDIFHSKAEFLTIVQSYRTTVEIMNFANKVIKKLQLKEMELSKPVIRHGEEVTVRVCDSQQKIAEEIISDIRSYQNKGYRSIAVICKTLNQCMEIENLIGDAVAVQLMRGDETEFLGGTLLLPIHLSKGLEFDGVIIADASSSQYKTNELDIKLLYIAMTRALHELKIYAEGQATELFD